MIIIEFYIFRILQNVSVWANHFSLYPLHVNHDLYFPENTEKKRKETVSVWKKKLTRAIKINAEPCFIVPRRSNAKKNVEKNGNSVFVSTGRSDLNDEQNTENDQDTTSDYVVDWSLYKDVKGEFEEEQTCSGRTVFIERGPLPLYQLALIAQVHSETYTVVFLYLFMFMS